jgi:glycosyltransferase involved in cell wall biosynthesis
MSTPLVSIVIPCHNAARWLRSTLESALAQTWPRVEIILVDDGSRDDSLAMARGFEDRGLRVVSQANRGASAARNRGLELAGGDFIQFLDADDLLAPGKIAVQMARLAAAPAGCIASGEWARFQGEPGEAVFTAQPNWRDMAGVDFMLLHYDHGWMMPPIAWLCPRSAIEAAGPWREDLSLNDDGEYFCRVMLRSPGIVFSPGSRAYYRSGLPSSLSDRRDETALRSLARSIEANTGALLAREQSARVRQACANAWRQVACELYPRLPGQAGDAERRALALGGARRRIEGGRLVRWTDRLFGWRAASRVKNFLR